MRPSATKTSIYNPNTVKVPSYQSRYQRPLNNQPNSMHIGPGGYPTQHYGSVHPPPYSLGSAPPIGFRQPVPSAPPPAYHSGFPGYHSQPPPAYHTIYPGNHPPNTNINYGHATVINNGGVSSGYVRHSDSSDNTLLGLYVGYKIGQLSSHSHYHRPIYYDSTHQTTYAERNYEVHHYYHGRESVPNKATLESNSITVCKPETKDMCIGSSVPLCMQDGTFLCVSDPKSTVPCKDNNTLKCVNAVVPCLNSTDPGCKNSSTNTTSISMPCISTVNINGTFNASMFNNSIISGGQMHNKKIDNDTLFCVTILAAPIVNATTNNIGIPVPGGSFPVAREGDKHLSYGIDQGEMWLRKIVYNIWG